MHIGYTTDLLYNTIREPKINRHHFNGS